MVALKGHQTYIFRSGPQSQIFTWIFTWMLANRGKKKKTLRNVYVWCPFRATIVMPLFTQTFTLLPLLDCVSVLRLIYARHCRWYRCVFLLYCFVWLVNRIPRFSSWTILVAFQRNMSSGLRSLHNVCSACCCIKSAINACYNGAIYLFNMPTLVEIKQEDNLEMLLNHTPCETQAVILTLRYFISPQN